MKKYIFLVLVLLLYIPFAKAQQRDTLRLTLPQVDEQFLKANLQLVATKLGIDENKAYELQAKLFPNPTVYFETMPYNTATKKLFPIAGTAGDANGNGANQILQFQQLVQLSHKIQKQVAIAQTNTVLAEDKFYDLMRNLRYQLHITFYDIYYNQETIKLYNAGIENLQKTVSLYQEQYDKENVPLKDLARLKAYLFSITNERQVFLKELVEDQAVLGTLMGLKVGQLVEPLEDKNSLVSLNPDNLQFADLLNTAMETRYDLRGMQDAAKLEQQNLTLQKALAVPDLTFAFNYARNGSTVPNYLGLGVGLPIPIFNKNQGNIKAANVRIQSSKVNVESFQLQVEKDIERSLIKARQADKLYKTFDNKFNDDFAKLIKGVEENYRKRNLSVVEFIDFFDAYKATVVQYSQLQNDRMQFFENLNFTVGKAVLGK